jgi:hypothetical protein
MHPNDWDHVWRHEHTHALVRAQRMRQLYMLKWVVFGILIGALTLYVLVGGY